MRRLALILIAGIVLGVVAGFLIWQELAPSGQTGSNPTGLALGQGSSSGSGPWTLTVQGSNDGGSPITISTVSIDGRDYSAQVSSPGLPIAVQPGHFFSFSITVASGGVTYSPGQTLEVDVQDSDGVTVSTQISLPPSGGSPGGGSGGGNEKLVLTASVVGGALNVTMLNESPGSVTVLQVYFNSVPATFTLGSGFDQTGHLASAASGTFTVATSGTISGTLYNIVVITGTGSSFQTPLIWP